jgi:hypothetical protein
VRVSFLLLIIVACGAAAHAQKPAAPRTSSATPAKIICFRCSTPTSGANTPFAARTTLLGQHLDLILPQIANQTGVRQPIVIQTSRTTIVAAVEGGPVDEISAPELEYLQTVFPGFKAGPSLDAHQEAHLLAHRFRQVEKDLGTLLALSDGRPRAESGPSAPVASSHVEVFVISRPEGHEAFTAFNYEPESRPLLAPTLRSIPTATILAPNLKEPGVRCRLVYGLSMALLSGLSIREPGLPGWLRAGIARALEDRHASYSLRSPPIASLTTDPKHPGDWNAVVMELVNSNKAGDLGALAATPLVALSLRSEAQSWSMVRWMIDTQGGRFPELVRLLLQVSPEESPAKATLAAVRTVFDQDLVSLVDAWKAHVLKGDGPKK